VSRRTILRSAALAAVTAPLLSGCDPSPPSTSASRSPSTSTSPSARLAFPAGFVWGAATSAYQIEGAAAVDGRGPSIWDTFSHRPGTIADGSTGDIACDHYHRWAGDLDLMHDLGLRSYRFSLSWPRILPSGRGAVNQKGLDFYERLIDGLHQRGIQPLATLFHWDLPQPLQDKGGWENRDCAQWFADYADVVFRAVGTAVPTWLTINEPKTIVEVGYTYGSMAPGKQDQVAAAVVSHHLALAHGLAVQAYRAAVRSGRIGPALNLAPAYPAQPGAEAAATLADGRENRLYLEPILKGSYPTDVIQAMPAASRTALQAAIRPGDLKSISAPVDLLGVNYYYPVYVDSAGRYQTLKPTSIATWEQIYPPGLTDLLVRLARDYPTLPLVITENGIPNAGSVRPTAGTVDDPERIAYLRDHLVAAQRAIAAGARLEGYHLWSLLDNFEWAQGYTQRWGIVHVDFDTQVRTPKRSAQWYRDVIAANAVPVAG
jgi:beta-glucosidase